MGLDADPEIHSANYEWDSASTADAWKRAHNHLHHTYTNVLGRDRDLGYAILRIDAEQPWRPVYLAQPLYIVPMALLFEWAIAIYDIELENVRAGKKPWTQAKDELAASGARRAASSSRTTSPSRCSPARPPSRALSAT